MQDSRWFRIVYILLDTGKCTASELAEKLEVSVRTIYRDLDALSAAGIPVYATQGKARVAGSPSCRSTCWITYCYLARKKRKS